MAEQKRGPGRPKGSTNKNSKSQAQKGAKTTKTTKKADTKAKGRPPVIDPAEEAKRKKLHNDIASVVLIAVGAFLVVALQTKIAGAAGAAVGGFLKGLFGFGAYLLPYFLILYAILMLVGVTKTFQGKTVFWMIVLFLAMDLINGARFVEHMEYGILGIKDVYDQGQALTNGGVFGMYIGSLLYRAIGLAGLIIVAVVLIIISVLLLLSTPVSTYFENAAERRRLRRERKAEQKAQQAAIEAERRAMEQEFKEKAKAVESAGRKSADSYRTPSEQANIMTTEISLEALRKGEQETATEAPATQEPAQKFRFKSHNNKKEKLNAKQIKKLPDNQRKIIEMVQDPRNTLFGDNTPKPGFGINSETPDAIRQPHTPTIQTGTEPTYETGRVYMNDQPVDPVTGEIFDETPTDPQWRQWHQEQPVPESVYPSQGAATTPQPQIAPATPASPAAASVVPPAAAPMKPNHDIAIGAASVATATSETEKQDSTVKVTPKRRGTYTMPFFNLLDETQTKGRSASRQELHEKAALLESTLASFGVEATVNNVISGPSVTRYEIEPAQGVKVSSITKLSDDLALNMRAKSIRIEAPIPGKAAVGIEIENEERQMIGLREIIQSKQFKEHKSKLAFAVGIDIGGSPVVADLAKMPHLLIAGATGSGKSVCINAIIMSLLYKANPDELKMLMVDPKMVELGNYNDIPHLIHPVVTDPHKAAAALNKMVAEMTRRYQLFSQNGVRDLGAYNDKMQREGQTDEILPQIVIIIDELADLMMVASSQVEAAIVRLAQLARAAGMHMILATQRPSVDVITGLIKANVPSRIAFMVTSQVDSRTIIDKVGAEKLVGNGDMLFKPQDLNEPKRLQGPFVSDKEIERVLTHVRNQHIEPDYDLSLTEAADQEGGSGGAGDGDGSDELLLDAVELVMGNGQASVSMLQRRFRIGYNRAARIIDEMEEKGFVGPPDGTHPRQVLITPEQFEQLKAQG